MVGCGNVAVVFDSVYAVERYEDGFKSDRIGAIRPTVRVRVALLDRLLDREEWSGANNLPR